MPETIPNIQPGFLMHDENQITLCYILSGE